MSIVTAPLQNPQLWHRVFELMGIVAGVQWYRVNNRGTPGILNRSQFPIVVGALLGAGIGNKAVFWLDRADLWQTLFTTPAAWFMGQSMVGGLLGGLLGVETAKKLIGRKESTGDRFVYPILLALCIGRVGCFVAGLSDGTFGNPSALPWAVDFGDGIPRHPTQLYEIVFTGVLWMTLARWQNRLSIVSGLQFKLMLSGYLVWRLLIDFIKPVFFEWPWGLSGIQWTCLIALIVYLPGVWNSMRQLRTRLRGLLKIPPAVIPGLTRDPGSLVKSSGPNTK